MNCIDCVNNLRVDETEMMREIRNDTLNVIQDGSRTFYSGRILIFFRFRKARLFRMWYFIIVCDPTFRIHIFAALSMVYTVI